MKVQFLASGLTVFHLLQPNTLSFPRSATGTVVCPNAGLNATYQVCPLVAHFHIKASLAGAVLARDVTCRLTNHIESTEHAHLVPPTEIFWFSQNSMFRYNDFPILDIDDPHNGIQSSSYIHTIFGEKTFCNSAEAFINFTEDVVFCSPYAGSQGVSPIAQALSQCGLATAYWRCCGIPVRKIHLDSLFLL
jgi:hypothetical protein